MTRNRLDPQLLGTIAQEQARNVIRDNYDGESVEQLLQRAVKRGYYAYHNLHVVGADVGSVRSELP
jgi:hypothetical protein